MNKSIKNNTFYSLVIFLLSPFISLILAVKNPRESWSKNLVWLFVIFYAISFTIPSDSSDAFRYKEGLERLHWRPIDFTDFVDNFYTDEVNIAYFRSPYDDIIYPFINYFVSLFTDNFRVLYFFVGLISGFFYSRNIWFLFESIKGKIQPVHVVILLGFALIIPFWNLNSIRMWTAAHMFFFGAIQFLEKGNIRAGAMVIILSVMMHFSFLLPAFAFFIYFLFGNRTRIYFIIFLITFFINEIDLGTVRTTLTSVLPKFLHGNVEAYTPDVEIAVKVRSWHAVYYQLVLKWTVFAIMLILYWFGVDRISKRKTLLNIFAFTLLFLSIAQISSLLPSGGRFLKVADLFAFTSLFLFIENFKEIRAVKRSFYILSPGLIFFCLVSMRIGLDSINLGLLGNIFTLSLLGPIEIPIIDLIK